MAIFLYCRVSISRLTPRRPASGSITSWPIMACRVSARDWPSVQRAAGYTTCSVPVTRWSFAGLTV
jgi:hypothetical protein